MTSRESLAEAFGAVARAIESADNLAFALFRTDPEVKAFVARVGEDRPGGLHRFRTLVKAWRRDELGKQTEYWERALRVLAVHPSPFEVDLSATHARARTEASADVVDGKAYHVQVDRADRAEERVKLLEEMITRANFEAAMRAPVKKPADPFDAEALAILRSCQDAQKKMTPRPVRVGDKIGVDRSGNTFYVAYLAVADHARTRIRVKLQGYEHAGSLDGSELRHLDGAPVDELASIALLGTPGPGDPPGYSGIVVDGAEGRIAFYVNPPVMHVKTKA